MTTQTYVTDVQSQALEAVKTGQTAALEAVQTWRDAVAKLTPHFSSVSDPKDTIGDPIAILDSGYDFAQELIELNRAFAHQLLDASQTAPKKSAAKSAKR
jgi:hypothetical protein